MIYFPGFAALHPGYMGIEMDQIINQVTVILQTLQKNLYFTLCLVGSLYLIHIVNCLLGHRLIFLGIYPRKVPGLIGVPCSPFIHGNFNHLFFNSIPLFVLVSFVLLYGFPTFYVVSAIIMLFSGVAVWMFARKGFHVGASGVIMGYWGYLLVNAYYHPTILSVAIAVVCLYYFGGLLFNLFPQEVKSSWEAHIFGFLSGVAASYMTPYILHQTTQTTFY